MCVLSALGVGKGAHAVLDVVASAALTVGVSLVSFLKAGDWTSISTPARHYF